MRVGLVIYGPLDSRSGGYLYDRKLFEYLGRMGDSVEIFSLPYRNYPRHLTDNFSTSLFEKLRDLDVDILLQDELNHPSLFRLNKRLKRSATYPIISIVHHLRSSETHAFLPMQVYRPVERAYLRSVDGFIFNSTTTESVVHLHLSGEKPAVVAVPGKDNIRIEITPGEIEDRANAPGPIKIQFVGNVTSRKGLHTLLEALTRLETEDWRLSVIGGLTAEPEYVRRQQEFVTGRGWDSRVQFAGFVPPDRLADHLLDSHILAGPSQYEGFGIAYLEALGAGLPVIATTGGAAGEFIRNGENGFLIPPDDPLQLAQSLDLLIRDRKMILRMGLEARDAYEKHQTWDKSMHKAREFLVGLGV